MPTTRRLYTLSDIKAIIAKDSGVDVGSVLIFDGNTICLESCGDLMDVGDDSFLFQVEID